MSIESDEPEEIAKLPTNIAEAQQFFKDNHPHPENMSFLELMAKVKAVDPRYAHFGELEFFCEARDVLDHRLGIESYQEALRTDGQNQQVRGFLIGLLERKKIETLQAAGGDSSSVRVEGDRYLRLLFPDASPNDP